MNRNKLWISVKDKPPRFKNVLCYTKMGQYCITCVDMTGEFDDYPVSSDQDRITHWMPLPKPPSQTKVEPENENESLNRSEEGQATKLLRQLCELKLHKDKIGKDAFYEKRQPELWEEANEFLNGL